MLIFPVFGSAIAAVATYLMSGTRTRRLRLLQRVLDLVRKALGKQEIAIVRARHDMTRLHDEIEDQRASGKTLDEAANDAVPSNGTTSATGTPLRPK